MRDWPDEQIVLGYRTQHHVEVDFRHLKPPLRYASADLPLDGPEAARAGLLPYPGSG
jgi:hypothetical protein